MDIQIKRLKWKYKQENVKCWNQKPIGTRDSGSQHLALLKDGIQVNAERWEEICQRLCDNFA